jgi:DNA-binding SARP family transcriptional activator
LVRVDSPLVHARPRITLLDGFDVENVQVARLPVPSKRLLAFLAIGDRPLERDYVAYSLWPDARESRAIASFRTAVWEIRERAPHLLDGDGEVLGLADNVDVDYHDLRRDAFRLADLPLDGSIDRLVDGYSKDLLPEWYDDWTSVARARWLELRLHALDALATRLTVERRHLEAIDAAVAAVAIEPLRETSRRTLIRAYLAEGNRIRALQELERFGTLLRQELDSEPSPELVRLAHSGHQSITTTGPTDEVRGTSRRLNLHETGFSLIAGSVSGSFHGDSQAQRGGLQPRRGAQMALYKRIEEIGRVEHQAFDPEYGPGQQVPHSGIYRCRGCSREIASNQGTPFPPQNHHQHGVGQGTIRWRLCVYAQGEPS